MHTNKPKVIDRKILADNYDLNLVTTSGWYEVKSPLNGVKDVINHKVFVMAPNQSKSVTQFVFDEDTKTDMMWFRTSSSSTWSEWKEVATADKFVSKSGDTITGDLKVTGKIDGSLAGKPEAPTPTKDGGDNQIANVGYVNTQISGLVDSAPDALNTLKELAAALGNDQNFSTTITNALAEKLPKAGGTISGDLTVQGKVIGTASFAEKDKSGNDIVETYARKEDIVINIGTILPFLSTKIPEGWLSLEDGQEVSRTAYPGLWTWVQANAPLISETEWQTRLKNNTSVGAYSTGNGSTTFRLPKIIDFVQGGHLTDVGAFMQPGLPNIKGHVSNNGASGYYDATGAITLTDKLTNIPASSIANTSFYDDFDFDASRSNTIYGNSTTVQPAAIRMVYCVKAFGIIENQGAVDVSKLADDIKSRGIPVGTIQAHLVTKIPDGWLSLENGQEVSRTAFPDLWNYVQANAPVISEADWQAKAKLQTSVGYYSTGDGTTTFRLPKIVDFVQGSALTDSGNFAQPGLPNITGKAYIGVVEGQQGTFGYVGALQKGNDFPELFNGGSKTVTQNSSGGISIDASKSNSIYGASTTVQPPAIKMVYCVKAFGVAVNQGTVDVTALADSLNNKLSISDIPAKVTGRIVAQSLGQNGWVKFDTGFIKQWTQVSGMCSITDDSVKNTGTFPIAFPNKGLSIQMNSLSFFSVNYAGEIYGAGFIDSKTFSHYFFSARPYSVQYYAYVEAIGY